MTGDTAEKFVIVSESVLLGLRCGDCVRLYGYLNLRQGSGTRAVRGIAKATSFLGWQARTAHKHARHLAAAGLIALDPAPAPGWGNTELRVLHNPQFKRRSPLTEIKDVWEPLAPTRWRPPNHLSNLMLSDAPRDAPGGCSEELIEPQRDVPSVWDEARHASCQSAPRLGGVSKAERSAPSVPRSTRSGLGLAVPDQPKGSPFNEECVSCDDPGGGAPYAEVAVRTGGVWRGWWCPSHVDDAVSRAGNLHNEGMEVELVDADAYREMTAVGAVR
jgi:hypothetical protein